MSDSRAPAGPAASASGSERASALERAARAAVLAPSVHNTQPWRFRIDGRTLRVSADRDRQLRSLDPSGRLMLVSCGCAVACAQARLRADGWSPEITLLPEGADTDHVADLRLVEDAPAPEPSATARSLGEAIERRHSQREPFGYSRLSKEMTERLRAVAREEGGWFRLLRDDDERLTFTTLLDQADWLERSDPAYRDEVRAWVRTEPAPDGVPAGALPRAGLQRDDVLLREFDPDSPAAARRLHEGSRTTSAEHAVIALMGTERDRRLDWIVAGRALGSVLLVLTADGLQASVLGQVVDLPRTRRTLQGRLGLRGPVQVALRIGRGPEPAPTPRRPLEDVLTLGDLTPGDEP